MASISAMATSEVSAESLERLRFTQMMETNEHTAAMARLYAQQERLRQELSEVKTTLAEVLRRLPEPGQS